MRLEDTLIFYPVPSESNEQPKKSASHTALEAGSKTLAKPYASNSEDNLVHNNNIARSLGEDKKRKSPTLIEQQPKKKKLKAAGSNKTMGIKPSKTESGESLEKQSVINLNSHTDGDADVLSPQSSNSARPPWFDRTITDVLRCDACDFICLEHSDLLEHKHEIHAVKNMIPSLAPCDYDPAVDQNVQYKCTLCGLADDRLRHIRTHITSHHDGKLKSCERVTHTRSETGFSLLVESVKVYKH